MLIERSSNVALLRPHFASRSRQHAAGRLLLMAIVTGSVAAATQAADAIENGDARPPASSASIAVCGAALKGQL